MKWAKRIGYIALYLIGFAIVGVTAIVTADVSTDVWHDWTFYANQILTDIAILFVTYGTVYLIIDRNKESNEEYKLCDRAITEFAVGKTYVPSILSRFLETLNRKRKIQQYKWNIKLQLHKLETAKKGIFRRKRKYNENDFRIWNHGTEEEKAKNEYCRKRKDLEERLSETYINETIDLIYVRYDRVTADVLLSGVFMKRESEGPNEFITKNQNGKIIAYKLPRLLISFAFVFIISSFAVSSINFNMTALVNVLSKSIALAWNTVVGIRYGERFFAEVTLKDIRFRRATLVEYDKWLTQEAQKASVRDEISSHESQREGFAVGQTVGQKIDDALDRAKDVVMHRSGEETE